jgi:hypothetical protein
MTLDQTLRKLRAALNDRDVYSCKCRWLIDRRVEPKLGRVPMTIRRLELRAEKISLESASGQIHCQEAHRPLVSLEVCASIKGKMEGLSLWVRAASFLCAVISLAAGWFFFRCASADTDITGSALTSWGIGKYWGLAYGCFSTGLLLGVTTFFRDSLASSFLLLEVSLLYWLLLLSYGVLSTSLKAL